MSTLRLTASNIATSTTALVVVWSIGCSDPAAPPARGAYEGYFGGSTCTAKSPDPHTAIGAITQTGRQLVVDGEGLASVSCGVTAASGGFAVSGTLRAGASNSFTVRATGLQRGTAAAGTITVKTIAGAYQLEEGASCEVTPISVQAGSVWASFKCDTLLPSDRPNEVCSLYDAMFVFENCAQ